MDKLEKALEKARKLRDEAMGHNPFATGSRQPSAVPGIAPQLASVLPQTPAISTEIDASLDAHRIVAHHMRSAEADIFRILRTQVLQIMKNSNFRTLAITSANYGDGKTTTALNLAISIALDLKQTVLLADLDLRKPNLHEFLGLERNVGLSDYLMHNKPISECLARLPFDRLTVLPAGPALENSSEVLGSPKMVALADELKSRYNDRIVIYDMPPVLSQDDSIAFLPHVDAVLMVVRNGVTRTDEIKRCLASLAGTNVIGIVLNDSTDVEMPKNQSNKLEPWNQWFFRITKEFLKKKIDGLKNPNIE